MKFKILQTSPENPYIVPDDMDNRGEKITHQVILFGDDKFLASWRNLDCELSDSDKYKIINMLEFAFEKGERQRSLDFRKLLLL